jgi:hypothetical protein
MRNFGRKVGVYFALQLSVGNVHAPINIYRVTPEMQTRTLVNSHAKSSVLTAIHTPQSECCNAVSTFVRK